MLLWRAFQPICILYNRLIPQVCEKLEVEKITKVEVFQLDSWGISVQYKIGIIKMLNSAKLRNCKIESNGVTKNYFNKVHYNVIGYQTGINSQRFASIPRSSEQTNCRRTE